MKTEKFNITVLQNGEQLIFPVEADSRGTNVSVRVTINGREVHFSPDEHGGLRPSAAECNLDPELLYQIGRAISRQRPS